MASQQPGFTTRELVEGIAHYYGDRIVYCSLFVAICTVHLLLATA